MATETELKLRVKPEQIDELLLHPLLHGLPVRKYTLLNTYYDTSDFSLRKHGVGLRFRCQENAVWLMSVKTAASGAGGLVSRGEWETQVQPGVFDFSIIEDETFRLFLETVRPNLRKIFSTNFTRMAWLVEQENASVEVALDQGWVSVSSQKHMRPFCELELELVKGGTPQTLFGLAIEFSQNLVLHPEIISKARRGYELVTAIQPEPSQVFVSSIKPEYSAVEAFRSVALTSLNMLQENEAGAVVGTYSEYVHQAGIAIDRLCSAFKIFSPALAPQFINIYKPRWKALAGELGITRDLDVFHTKTLLPLMEMLPDNTDLQHLHDLVEQEQMCRQSMVSVALNTQEYSHLLLAFSAALFWQEKPGIAGADHQAEVTIKTFAISRLEKMANSIAKRIEQYDHRVPVKLHQLCIVFSRLCYALEFFAPIFTSKKYMIYVAQLVRIQDLLGKFNDQVVAERLTAELFSSAESVLLLRCWTAARIQILTEILEQELQKLIYAERPWLLEEKIA